jgi:hypothetical protein
MLFPASGWVTTTGDGLIGLLNLLTGETGVPQGIIAGAMGSTALTRQGYDASSAAFGAQNGWWLNTTSSPWTPFTAALNSLTHPLTPGAGQIKGIIWDQGESDSITGVSFELYLRALFQLWSNIQALVTVRKPPLLRFAMIPTGFYNPTPAAGYTVNTDPVVRAQRAFVKLQPGAYIAATRDDLPRDTTNVHLTANGYGELGARLARAIAREEYGL